MADNLKCVICASEKDEKVLLFSEETLKKCQRILDLRKHHNLKYKDVILPSDLYDCGYHRSCYRVFTALKTKFYEMKDTKKKDVAPSTSQSNKLSTESLSVQQPSTSTDNSMIAETVTQNVDLSLDSSVLDEVEIEGNNSQLDTSLEASFVTDSDVLNSPTDNLAAENESPIVKGNICFFCEKKNKKFHGKIENLRSCNKDQFQESIMKNLKINSDYYNEMLDKLQNITSNKIYYHEKCRTDARNKKKLQKSPVKTSWHISREYHQTVFQEICTLIEENVIKKGRCYFLSFLHRQYIDYFSELSNDMGHTLSSVISSQYLEEKIRVQFAGKIQILQSGHKKVIAPKGITSIDESLFAHLKERDILQAAASILHKEIMNIEKTKLPDNLNSQKLIQGECSVPSILSDFVASVIGSYFRKRQQSESFKRHVNSVSQDLIYMTHNGNLKTPKHICLGITLKSLTSSRKVVDIINRYGHCISYNAIEELETEATYTSTSRAGLCPEIINRTDNLSVGIAYDNFDRFVDTKTGKDTLHDTVGIIYQNIDPTLENIEEIEDVDDLREIHSKRRRRRSFEAIDPELPFFPKKSKMSSGFQPEVSEREEENIIIHEDLYNRIDTVWMLSHAVHLPDIPMWAGFNSAVTKDDSPQQLISYLTPINASPTAHPVVLETMEQSMKILEEINQPYMQVTYDLAIAKIAFQIKATETSKKFSKLFIHLGSFHIMLSYFKAIGKFIDGCGLSTIMVESELLASGSVASFLDGKHFNRCKRLHPMMALGLQILHFRSFLEHEKIEISDDIYQELQRLKSCQTPIFFIHDEKLKELCANYAKFEEQTLHGDFGKTAQFYMVYVKLVHYYLTLSRSIRLGDFELFKNILPKITNLFFSFNHQNYARWTVTYHYNLMKVASTHPGLEEDFKKGFFGIKRTGKPFSRQPIDLTLEQTINADAARRLTGITHLTDSIAARQRWARSHDIRSTIITHVLEEIGINKKQDISAELQPSNIKKSCEQLEKFVKSFDQYINPFSPQLPPNQLFNISSGKAASTQVEDFLLNVEKIGDDLRKAFISECSLDINRFDKPIKKIPIHNFSSQIEKKNRESWWKKSRNQNTAGFIWTHVGAINGL